MDGRRRLAPQERRAQLLDAATRLAAGADLQGLSVADIAAAAGVSEGLLYRYFPSKDALLLAVVQRAADALTADLEHAAAQPGGPVELLSAGLGAYLDHVQRDPTGWRALLAAVAGEPAAVWQELERRSTQLVLDALDVEPSPALLLLLSSWTAMERAACLSWLERPGTRRADVEDLLLTTFLGGLTALAARDEQARRALERLGQVP